jgi:hypothetical protein
VHVLYDSSLAAFLVLDIVLGGLAAFAAGRAIALGWRGPLQAVAYMLLLALAVRFFHFALAGGTLLSPQYYAVDAAILIAIALIAHRFTRAGQMVRQYPWLYRRTSPIIWAAKGD